MSEREDALMRLPNYWEVRSLKRTFARMSEGPKKDEFAELIRVLSPSESQVEQEIEVERMRKRLKTWEETGLHPFLDTMTPTPRLRRAKR